MKNIALAGLLAIIPCVADTPKFEMSDVHVSSTAPGFVQIFGGIIRNGKYINRDVTMIDLIQAAYGVKEDMIAGGSGWVSSQLYDVIAKVPDGTTAAGANQMLQELLAERFKLVIHKDTRPVPRFVLGVAKGGLKMKPANGSGTTGCQQYPQANPPAPGGPPVDLAATPNVRVGCHNLGSGDIATNLRQMAGAYLDHDVIDSTNLEGNFDFDLEWTGRGALAAKGADGISVFDAVSKQLGLKLELQNVPMPVMVIESVSKTPTPNADGVAKILFEAPPRFDAASIKIADPDKPGIQGLRYTGGSQMRAGGNLRFMIALALQIPPNVATDTLIGLPKFADNKIWDITARVPSTGEGAPQILNGRPQPPPFSVGLQMLHGLLIDQFELKTHTENRDITVYALVANGKHKMTPADDAERSGCKADPSLPKPVLNMGPMTACKNTTMHDLAATIMQLANAYIDHPIVDGTGLQGGFNFAMGWSARGQLNALAPNPNGPGGGASDPDGITVFEAMEKQLGLKLVKQTKSIPVIVVDHLAEKPVEN